MTLTISISELRSRLQSRDYQRLKHLHLYSADQSIDSPAQQKFVFALSYLTAEELLNCLLIDVESVRRLTEPSRYFGSQLRAYSLFGVPLVSRIYYMAAECDRHRAEIDDGPFHDLSSCAHGICSRIRADLLNQFNAGIQIYQGKAQIKTVNRKGKSFLQIVFRNRILAEEKAEQVASASD